MADFLLESGGRDSFSLGISTLYSSLGAVDRDVDFQARDTFDQWVLTKCQDDALFIQFWKLARETAYISAGLIIPNKQQAAEIANDTFLELFQKARAGIRLPVRLGGFGTRPEVLQLTSLNQKSTKTARERVCRNESASFGTRRSAPCSRMVG